MDGLRISRVKTTAARGGPPISDWYDYANGTAPPLDPLYFNYLSDFRLVKGTCGLATPFLPGCRNRTLLSIGDGILRVGSEDPTSTHVFGGASFAIDRTGPRFFPDAQWVDRTDVSEQYDLQGYNPYSHGTLFALIVADSPALHGRIPLHLNEISIPSCTGNGNSQLSAELVELNYTILLGGD